MITPTFAKPDNEALLQPNVPSVSWFAVRSLQGLSCAEELLQSPLFKKGGAFKQLPIEGQVCWRCGGDIHHPASNGYAAPYVAGAKFNDHWECAGKGNAPKVICLACEVVGDRAYHPNFNLTALYTGDKAYQLTKDEDLISFLVNPPPPPYLFCMAEANSQHVCWLSRYTLDNKLLAVTKGRATALVDRQYAYDLATRFCRLLESANVIRDLRNQQTLATPFLSSRKDINGGSSTNMAISRGIYSAAIARNDDPLEVAEKLGPLRQQIDEMESIPFCYITWFVMTMYVKAILTNFEPKDISEWPLMKQPK
jgi:CRISPR type IV-associated protein Csf1